ncbi:MAG: VCBS repeat-containing protein [Planctomycetes bacterium]|nr:VCBS repeat-containing protein [Planctomycetota bacterium]
MKALLIFLCCAPWVLCQSLKSESVALPPDVNVDDWFLVDADGDGVRELLLVDANQHRLVLLKAPWTKAERRDIPLPNDVAAFSFVDLADPPGEDLLLLTAHGASLLAGMRGPPQPWLQIELLLPAMPRGAPRCHEWARDHNGDGWDDVLLPGLDHEWLVFNDAHGAAGTKLALTPAATFRLTRTATGAFQEQAVRARAGLLRRPATPSQPLAVVLTSRGVEHFTAATAALDVLFELPGKPAQSFGFVERVECSVAALEPGTDDALLVARTRAEEGRIPEPRTELLLYRQGTPQPAGALLLSGMLSTGPDLVDVNGDGKLDLALTLVASGVRGELQRAIGRCPVTFHLYLHRGGGMPWPRSPDFSLTDIVDAASFDRWGLRHRVFLAGDMDGDGLQELARVRPKGDGLLVELRHGRRGQGGPFDEEVLGSCVIEGNVRAYAAVSLGKSPAVMLRYDKHYTFLTWQR